MHDLSQTFQFPLDDFQQQAVQLFLNGSSVLVCAPTGAGKTAIAEAAAVAVLARSAHTSCCIVISSTDSTNQQMADAVTGVTLALMHLVMLLPLSCCSY